MVKRIALGIARNVLGWTLVILGTFFGWLPFVQGIAMVLVGLAIADWPGKRRAFRYLRTQRWFRKLDAWGHTKFGFRLPEHRSHRRLSRPPATDPPNPSAHPPSPRETSS